MTHIIALLSDRKFSLHNEKILQHEINAVLFTANVSIQREYRLDEKNVIDFFCVGVGVEIKINGSRKEIFRQCQRYCQFNEITSLILVTNRAMGLPESINNKPCRVINLGRAWL